MKRISAGEYMSGHKSQPQELHIKCVECGSEFHKCSGHGHSEVPQPGDVTICWDCGCIMAITKDGQERASPEMISAVKRQLGVAGMLKYTAATGKEIH